MPAKATTLFAALVLGLVCLAPGRAMATIINYTVNATALAGTLPSLTGSFTYDTTTNTFSNINLTLTDYPQNIASNTDFTSAALLSLYGFTNANFQGTCGANCSMQAVVPIGPAAGPLSAGTIVLSGGEAVHLAGAIGTTQISPADLTDGTVTAAPVPAPSTLYLLLSGLLGLAFVYRRRPSLGMQQ